MATYFNGNSPVRAALGSGGFRFIDTLRGF
jgi:hypothetical protein